MQDPKTIEQKVSQALENEHVELVDLVIQHQGKKTLLQFFVDKVGGVTLDDCGALTDKIDAVLEMENLVGGAYILEVSSPTFKPCLSSSPVVSLWFSCAASAPASQACHRCSHLSVSVRVQDSCMANPKDGTPSAVNRSCTSLRCPGW